MDKDTETQIKELQMLEQTLQNILMQKQAFQLELSETENALEELSKNNNEVFKISGNIMIKSSKENILKDLNQKRDLMALRLKSLDTQEKSFSATAENIRKKVLAVMKK